ncbi:MAG TPA: GGDEF domain-containing protein [Nitrospira sp.]|nr:GGDEF domain-containing protein [Nitrospira sp.]
MRDAAKDIMTFTIPGGLVLLAAVGFLRPHGVPVWLQQPVSAIPLVVLAFGLVFGWYLSSTRLILSFLVLVWADRVLTMFPPAASDPESVAAKLFAMSAFLVPLNLLAFSVFKEDAVSVIRSAARLALVCTQPFLILWLCDPAQQEFAASFDRRYIAVPTEWTPVPQAALAAFLLAGTMHMGRFLVTRDPFEAGSVWAIVALFLAYHGTRIGWQPSNFFAAAGFILFLSLLQSSHFRTYRDELTGIAGHRAYRDALERLGSRYAFAVAVVDQMKSYGNIHGKVVTSQVLQIIAPLVQSVCRDVRVYRASGDELTLLFPGRSATETLATLEAIRKAIEATPLVLRGRGNVRARAAIKGPFGRDEHELPVTVSIGVAEKAADPDTVVAVQKAAYRALHEAQSSGGNVVRRGNSVLRPPRRYRRGIATAAANGEY